MHLRDCLSTAGFKRINCEKVYGEAHMGRNCGWTLRAESGPRPRGPQGVKAANNLKKLGSGYFSVNPLVKVYVSSISYSTRTFSLKYLEIN